MLSSMNGELARVSENFSPRQFLKKLSYTREQRKYRGERGRGRRRGCRSGVDKGRPRMFPSAGKGVNNRRDPRVGERSFQRGGKLIYYCRRTVARKIGTRGLRGLGIEGTKGGGCRGLPKGRKSARRRVYNASELAKLFHRVRAREKAGLPVSVKRDPSIATYPSNG